MALPSPRSETRPTTDRTKEAIFSRLDSSGILEDARVLDLFAGTGALGVEALSRGADTLVAVESSPATVAAIRRMLSALRSHDEWQTGMEASVIKQRAEHFVQHYEGPAFDMVFCDPPYDLATEICNRMLVDVVDRHVVEDRAVIVFERSVRSGDLHAPEGWEITDTRTYGETQVWYFGARHDQ